MNLTAEQLQNNWQAIFNIIEKYIAEPRKTQLKEFFTKHEEYLVMAPASSKKEYHGCWPGGLIDHFLNVINNSVSLYDCWKTQGANMDTFTKEELIFSALVHDIGKLSQYIPSTDKWRQEKLGELYIFNTEIPFASVPDRGLFLLQQEGIKYSFNEMIAIQIHDGLYDEANKKYLVGFLPEQKPRTCLPYILHQADIMASRIEFEQEHADLLLPKNDKIQKEKKENFKLEVNQTSNKKIPIQQKVLGSIGNEKSSNLMNLLNSL